jgi:hypothetical protein
VDLHTNCGQEVHVSHETIRHSSHNLTSARLLASALSHAHMQRSLAATSKEQSTPECLSMPTHAHPCPPMPIYDNQQARPTWIYDFKRVVTATSFVYGFSVLVGRFRAALCSVLPCLLCLLCLFCLLLVDLLLVDLVA